MDKRIATISGTMLTPGVSRNKRFYSTELIARAAKRMQERISDPDGLPIVMRTHHNAGDDSRKIVGRLTQVKVGEDGAASYSADLYDTAPGRDIAALITGKNPALKSVSIHGYWLGPVKRVAHEGESVTTAEDLEVDALDFTASPGVLGANVAAASYLPDAPAAAESTAGRTPISESVEATVEAITEAAPVDEAGYSGKQRRQMAAKGQAMNDGAYPIASKKDLRKSIRAVGRGGADHDAIRRHIVKRAQALGLTSLIPDNWKADGSMKENTTRLLDVREYYPDGPEGQAGFCIDAFNGPISLTMRACGIDPADLRAITQAAMCAAVDALQAMDPDMDADIDVDDTDSDDGGESAPEPPAAASEALKPATADVDDALTQTAPPDRGAATTTTEEEAAMGEPTTETDQTAAPARSLTDADISALGALFGAALKESLAPVTVALAENAPKASKSESEATESADVKRGREAKESKKAKVAKLQETVRAEMAELKESLREELLPKVRDELREELLRENGLPPRKGYRVHENEQSGPDETSPEDLYRNRAELLLGEFGRTPQPAQ
ncbi:hypothetical protein [Streptomyces yunnanensis]|uniref:Uncharacterized protein n=1 Tax=Streptomyces yunnanensis TaxID=156453 RepID=A0A9X8QSC5_9ACTN|nr:hypothetical protein [Streptomyces yunnanensis]SHL75655.1 hypothetical protein SAMN05216268_10689 [Streptomyces yunnanensis]